MAQTPSHGQSVGCCPNTEPHRAGNSWVYFGVMHGFLLRHQQMEGSFHTLIESAKCQVVPCQPTLQLRCHLGLVRSHALPGISHGHGQGKKRAGNLIGSRKTHTSGEYCCGESEEGTIQHSGPRTTTVRSPNISPCPVIIYITTLQ